MARLWVHANLQRANFGLGGMLAAVLGDGTYDAIVVDVEAGEGGTVALDLAIAAGAHRGDVVRVLDRGHDGEPLELLGLPATLTVENGQPSVAFDP